MEAITTGAATGVIVFAGGIKRMLTGRPAPARRPGIPKCSDNTRACNSSDTSTPAIRRRSDVSSVEAWVATVTLAMLLEKRIMVKATLSH
jgi:hypothetical protein